MLIVGLTGGIASGKSTVTSRLSSPPHSLAIIDLDVLARQVVEPGTSTLRKITRQFDQVINVTDGTLNRQRLGQIIFEDESKRKLLNSITHPAIQKLLVWNLVKCWMRGYKIVIVDSPLLIESETWKFCGHVVVVSCREDVQLSRLQLRNPDLTLVEVQQRVKAQFPLASKLRFADSILENSGTPIELEHQIKTFVEELKRSTGKTTWFLCWIFPPFGLLWGSLIVGWRLFIKQIGKPRQSHSPIDDDSIEMTPLRSRFKEL